MQIDILEGMGTPELDECLQAELRKDHPDGEQVRRILRILEAREKDAPVEVPPEMQAAWDRFVSQRISRPKARDWVPRVAASLLMVAAMLVVLLKVVPVEAQAGAWWDKFVSWTASRLSVFDLEKTDLRPAEHVFKTDNAGLQEVYDAVTELGVTVPVVPMWLPSGYTIDEFEVSSSQAKKVVYAEFTLEDRLIMYQVEVLEQSVLHEYQKDDTNVSAYEINGVKYHVMKNNGRLVAVWNIENIECSLSAECGEEDFFEIINSI